MRILLKGILSTISLVALLAAYLVWSNNRSVAPPDQSQLEISLERGIQWLLDNRQKVLEDSNSVLWRMIQQASERSGDERLLALFADYRKAYLEHNSNNIWRPLFYPKTWAPVRFQDIADFPYYNWHFIYAITCDRDLANVPEIAAQNDAAFCDKYPLRPACATHQMMGLLMLKRSQCGNPGQIDKTVQALQERIRKQLTWDPRVVDVYMQRVLMLVASGAGDMVKPIWLQQLIDAQQTDGGWSGFMPLLPVGKDRYIGTARILSIGTPKSDFHITAQGVLLFTLLTHPE